MHPKPTNGVTTDYPNYYGKLVDAADRRLKGNLLDNGAFQVWQRGTSFASVAALTWTADRWVHCRAGLVTGSTLSRQTGSQAQYCARVQRDNANAATGQLWFDQSLETVNSIPLANRYVTLAFRARCGANYSPASSLLGVQVATGTGTDQSQANGPTGAATPLSSSVTLTTSWQDFVMTSVQLGASITQAFVHFYMTPVGTAGAADYFEIEEVQLVHGEYTGNFPYKTTAEELANCQRTFAKSFAMATAPAQNAGVTGATRLVQSVGASTAQNWGTVPFPTRMRTSPVVTLYNPSVTNAQMRAVAAAADCASTTATAHEAGFSIAANSAAGTAAGQENALHWSAHADI